MCTYFQVFEKSSEDFVVATLGKDNIGWARVGRSMQGPNLVQIFHSC